MLEYGDYECPHCGEAYPIIKRIRKYFKKDLCFVYRNFPLSETHPHALTAACAAEAAALQDEFWLMHDILFENQNNLSRPALISYAREIDLTIDKFKTDIKSEQVQMRVEKDFESGVESGVNGTPTFFINGHRYDGYYNYDSLVSALAEELNSRRYSHG